MPLSKLDALLENVTGSESGNQVVNNIGTININNEVDAENWLARLTRESELANMGLSRGTQQ